MLSQAQWLTFFRLSKHSQKKLGPKITILFITDDQRGLRYEHLRRLPEHDRRGQRRLNLDFEIPTTPHTKKNLGFWAANLQNLKTQRLAPQSRLLAGTLENLPKEKRNPWSRKKGPKPAPHSGCVTYELSRNHHTIVFCAQVCDDWVIITGSSYDHV